LLFDAAPERAAELTRRLRQRGYSPMAAAFQDGAQAARPLGGNLAVVVLEPALADPWCEDLVTLLRRLVADHVTTLVWGGPDGLRHEGGPLVEWLAPDVSLDEIVGKVGTLARYAPLIHGFERELEHMQRLGTQLNHYFNEIDQEMRLAGRLQRDFLPRTLLNVPPYRFHAVYRPASWVSGDMYDAFRIDETHIGMFVADAMGHGVAAGLLTMFLRQALVAKRVAGSSYTILTPGEALTNLHDCLVRQKLPNCQFVTAAYGIIDLTQRELTVARAGHPYALHVDAHGQLQEIRSEGSLLGLADIPGEFEETRVLLCPGEKIVLYTDGVEDVFIAHREEAGDDTTFTPSLKEWISRPAGDFVRAVEDHLDCQQGSLHPADDVTVLAVEVSGD
jgi:sigma-B regulation protein RsbU (phosphoserine phosphatase)